MKDDVIRPWVEVSPRMVEIIARAVPIQRVRELGLYKHSHLKTMTQSARDDDPAGPLQVDTESCQVMLQPRVDEKTLEAQKYALARLPCGQWVYWEGRE